MRDLLNEYIVANKLDDKYDPLDLIEDLKENEEYEMTLRNSKGKTNPYSYMLQWFARLFILEEHFGKRRTILCYGAPNSGKSQFVEAFQEIFNGFEYRNTASKFALAMRGSDKSPSLVIAHEFKIQNFNDSALDNTKDLLEGRGGVIEHKGVDPIVAYKGANFFLACQWVHPVLESEEGKVEARVWNNYRALKARMKLFRFDASHSFSESRPFPLNAEKIAVLLKYYAEEWIKGKNKPG